MTVTQELFSYQDVFKTDFQILNLKEYFLLNQFSVLIPTASSKECLPLCTAADRLKR